VASREDIDKVLFATNGHWQEILPLFGIPEEVLNRKKNPCPLCGGKTRFTFDDKDGKGTWICHHCNLAGNGFDLVARVQGVEPKIAFRMVSEKLGLGYQKNEKYLSSGSSGSKTKPSQQPAFDEENQNKVEQSMRKIWDACIDLHPGNSGGLYFKKRSLDIPKSTQLALAQSLSYYEEEEGTSYRKKIGEFPALIMLIRKVGGKIVGLHRIYLSDNGDKAPVSEVKKSFMLWSGAKVGAAIQFDKPKDDLCIAEGPETALYVRQVMQMPTWSGIDAKTMAKIEIPKHVKRVWIFGDNDRSGVGQNAAWDLAERLKEQCEVRVIISPVEGKDLLDVGSLDRAFVLNAPLYRTLDRWPLPSSLVLSPVPDFHVDNLPECAWDYVADVQETIRCPLDYPAISVLESLSCVVGAGVAMRPNLKASFSVVPNLWGLVIGGASYKKTPGTMTVFNVIKAFEKEARKKYEKDLKKYEAQMRQYKMRLEGLEQIVKVLTKEAEKDDHKKPELERMQQRLDELEEPEKPKQKRFKVNNVTTKRLIELMNENPRGVFVYRDEMTGLIGTWEDPRNGEDRDFALVAWNGSGEHSDDTISRGNVSAENCCLSLFGGVHPHKMRELVKQTIRNGSDGLLARFQMMVYPDRAKWKRRDEFENVEAKNRFIGVLRELIQTDFVEFGAVAVENGRPYFQFTPEAYLLWDEWLDNLHEVKLSGKQESYTLIEEHLAKYPSLMASLAVLIHLADMADLKQQGKPHSSSVSVGATQKAIALCDYFEEHARRVYSLALEGIDQITGAVANGLKTGKITDEFTARDLIRDGYCDPKDRPTLYVTLDRLVSAKWLRLQPPQGIGRPTIRYQINPRIKNFKDNLDKETKE